MTARTTQADPSTKRQKLCSRAHADRVAYQLFDTTGANVAVVRTGDALQPYKVMPASDAARNVTELEIRAV